MSDLISREEATAVFKKHQSHMATHLWDYEQDMNAIPSADIMECARALKNYCDNTRCKECKLAEHEVMNDTDNYLCKVHYLRPECWDLPEGEKE